MMPSGGVNIGYYGFADRPRSQRAVELRLYSMLAVRLFVEGVAVEDNLDAYLTTAAGTIPPSPVAVHLLSAPAMLGPQVRQRKGLTMLVGQRGRDAWAGLDYAGQYDAPGLFVSDGPLVEVWPRASMTYTFADEDWASGATRLTVPIVVRSAQGISELRIYDGERLFRRFDGEGREQFRLQLELPGSLQRTLTLVVEDVEGGRAVANAHRNWKGGSLAPIFCGDRINHCDASPMLAKGPGSIRVSGVPTIDAGFTWDGGPQGARPAFRPRGALRPTLRVRGGQEGERGFANLPRLVLADEGAVRVRVDLDTLYDEAIPVVNPWRTYGPLGGASRRLRSTVRYTEFDRPSVGPHPYLYPGFAERVGAVASIFENDVTILGDSIIESIELFRSGEDLGAGRVEMLHGRGDTLLAVHELPLSPRRARTLRLRKGDWFGLRSDGTLNRSLHINRGHPLLLRISADTVPTITVQADLQAAEAAAGDTWHFEVMSFVDPLDAPVEPVDRLVALAAYLSAPAPLEVLRGDAEQVGPENGGPAGLFEIAAEKGAAAVRVGRPSVPRGSPLALRVSGLNPRWSAGVYLRQGYVLGHYGPARNRYRAAAVDSEGRAYLALYPELSETTEVVVGHPVVADAHDLFVQVTSRRDRPGRGGWHVSVNNPTDRTVRARLWVAMPMPGLGSKEWTVSLPPGSYRVLE
jgi:hypothetical protein